MNSGFFRAMWFIVLLPIISGCTNRIAIASFEILEPSIITYPSYVNKVGYLNRSPVPEQSISKKNLKSLDALDRFIIDTIVSRGIQRGFTEGRSGMDISYLESIEFLESRRRNPSNRNNWLDMKTKNMILDTFGLDALICQDYYNIELGLIVYQHDFVNDKVAKEIRLILDINWTVYVRDKISPIDSYQLSDTLYYYSGLTKESEQDFRVTELIRDATMDFGYRYGKRHVPAWNEISRIVYKGPGEELKRAGKYTDTGDWESARAIWESLLSDVNLKIASRANHNLAVLYEIRDDLDTALLYAKQSNAVLENSISENYIEDLETRSLNYTDLVRQVR